MSAENLMGRLERAEHPFDSRLLWRLASGQACWVKISDGDYVRATILSVSPESLCVDCQFGLARMKLEECVHAATRTRGSNGYNDHHAWRPARTAASRNNSRTSQFREYEGRSLGCLSTSHPIRRLCIRLVDSAYFNSCILLVIILNCITMALHSPALPEGTATYVFLDWCELVFIVVFSLECVCKVIAMSLLAGTSAYLRDGWCRFDFIVLLFAWLPLLFNTFANFSAIRSLRVLRVFRAIKWVPTMSALVGALWKSMPKCGE
ncbi:MAG: hypothetical protein SGPRY_014455, partial [Prymnesium sp.]